MFRRVIFVARGEKFKLFQERLIVFDEVILREVAEQIESQANEWLAENQTNYEVTRIIQGSTQNMVSGKAYVSKTLFFREK